MQRPARRVIIAPVAPFGIGGAAGGGSIGGGQRRGQRQGVTAGDRGERGHVGGNADCAGVLQLPDFQRIGGSGLDRGVEHHPGGTAGLHHHRVHHAGDIGDFVDEAFAAIIDEKAALDQHAGRYGDAVRIGEHGIALIAAHVGDGGTQSGAEPDAIAAIAFMAVVLCRRGLGHMLADHGVIGGKAAAGEDQRAAADSFADAIGAFDDHPVYMAGAGADDVDKARPEQHVDTMVGEFLVEQLHHVVPAMSRPAVHALPAMAIGRPKAGIEFEGVADIAGQPVERRPRMVGDGAGDHRIGLSLRLGDDIGIKDIGAVLDAQRGLLGGAGGAHEALRHGCGASGTGILFDQQHIGTGGARGERRHRATGAAADDEYRDGEFEVSHAASITVLQRISSPADQAGHQKRSSRLPLPHTASSMPMARRACHQVAALIEMTGLPSTFSAAADRSSIDRLVPT